MGWARFQNIMSIRLAGFNGNSMTAVGALLLDAYCEERDAEMRSHPSVGNVRTYPPTHMYLVHASPNRPRPDLDRPSQMTLVASNLVFAQAVNDECTFYMVNR